MGEDRAAAAAARGRQAARRAEELEALHGRLSSGEQVGSDDVAVADARVSTAAERATVQQDRSGAAFRRSAAAHRAAADLAGQVGHAEAEQEHREAAVDDDARAEQAGTAPHRPPHD